VSLRWDEHLRAYLVPVSGEMADQLSTEYWSDAVQLRIIDGELVIREPEPPYVVAIRGECPNCGGGLTLTNGGSVTCRDQACNDRFAASRLLRNKVEQLRGGHDD